MPVTDKQSKLTGLLNTRPRAVRLDEEPVKTAFPDPAAGGPAVFSPAGEPVLLTEWIKGNLGLIETTLGRYGGILFRGFDLASVAAFEKVVATFSQQTMAYAQRSSPRTEIAPNIYTSTDHPADQSINMHNELSYSPNWPGKIAFFCVCPAAEGGETPVADSRVVLSRLPAATVRKFAGEGVRYTRNLGGGLGLPWQEVFQTSDRAAVEQECARNRMQFTWKGDEHLEIRWQRPAIVPHPVTGEALWFNHAFFFNASTLHEAVREAVRSEDDLPFNTFYGGGGRIEPEVMAQIGSAYETARHVFAWQKGDLLLMDNMLMSHGRNPFAGERKIAVAMWELRS